MALVPISDAAEMVRRQQADLYRDVDSGLLQATRTSDGALLLDTSELLRVYGTAEAGALSPEQVKIAVLEERTRALERALALEAELRKVKDQVANELRARLADKDSVIKVLESKLMFLEDDKDIPTLSAEDGDEDHHQEAREARDPQHERADQPSDQGDGGHGGWWQRLVRSGRGGSPLSK